MYPLQNTLVILEGKLIGGQTPESIQNTTSQDQNTATGQNQDNNVTPVDEQATGAFPMVTTLLLYGAVIAAMYFFFWRPSRKKDKAAKEMQANLKVGENVITADGLFCKIVGVGEDSFCVEFGENRTIRAWILKSSVVGPRTPKMTPPAATEAPAAVPDAELSKADKKNK